MAPVLNVGAQRGRYVRRGLNPLAGLNLVAAAAIDVVQERTLRCKPLSLGLLGLLATLVLGRENLCALLQQAGAVLGT